MIGLFQNGHRHELDDTSSENGDNAAIRTNSEAQPTSHDQAGNFNRRPPSDKLPAASLWIRDGLLQKRVTGNGNTTWQLRHIVLSQDHILITKPESNRVVESIPLHEVTACAHKEDDTGPVEGQQSPAVLSSTSPTRKLHKKSPSLFQNQNRGIFEVMTTEDGYNGGRSYTLQCVTADEGQAWIHDVEKYARAAAVRRNLVKEDNQLERMQRRVKTAYDSEASQSFVAVLIMFNFAASIADAELIPERGTTTFHVLSAIDLVFTIMFAIELVINMFGNWITDRGRRFPNFFYDGWNIFDLVVVLISVVAAAFEDAPGVNGLRIMRVFRVMRVFRRLGSLRVLINALTSSIVPVLNAFVVLMLVTAVYAVLAVMLFAHYSQDLFGRFSSSIFTMFQVCTGDGWASTIVRPLWKSPGEVDPLLALFFISYILIVGTFLINIVIAVLLDEFISSVEAEKSRNKTLKIMEHEHEFQKNQGALDPVIKAFTTFTTPEDLDKEIDHLYDTLDTDESGGLTYEELEEGLRKLPFEPRIHISEEDFDAITEGKNLVNEEGEVDRPSFFAIVKRQMVAYVHKWLRHKMRDSEDDQYTLLVALKHLILLTNNQGAEERTETALSDMHVKLDSMEAMIRAIAPAGVADSRAMTPDNERLVLERRRRTSMFDRHVSTIYRDRRPSHEWDIRGSSMNDVTLMKQDRSPCGIGQRWDAKKRRSEAGEGKSERGSFTASEQRHLEAQPSEGEEGQGQSARRLSGPHINGWERIASIATIVSESGSQAQAWSPSAEEAKAEEAKASQQQQQHLPPDPEAHSTAMHGTHAAEAEAEAEEGASPVEVPEEAVGGLPPSGHGPMLSPVGAARPAPLPPLRQPDCSPPLAPHPPPPAPAVAAPRLAWAGAQGEGEESGGGEAGLSWGASSGPAPPSPLPTHLASSGPAPLPPLPPPSLQPSSTPPLPTVHGRSPAHLPAHARPDAGAEGGGGWGGVGQVLAAGAAGAGQACVEEGCVDEERVPRLAPAPATLPTRPRLPGPSTRAHLPGRRREPERAGGAEAAAGHGEAAAGALPRPRPLPQTPSRAGHVGAGEGELGLWRSGNGEESVGLDAPESVSMRGRGRARVGSAHFVSAQLVVASPRDPPTPT